MPSSAPPCPTLAGALPALLALAPRPQCMLLVEDSRFAAEGVRLLCRRAGLRLRRAETLAAARAHLRFYRPDVALVDLGLPDGSGLDLIAELRAQEARRPRIVAISGDPQGRAAALDAGADAFCAKPLGLAGHLVAILELTAAQAQALLAAAPTAGADARAVDPMALHDDLRRAHALLTAGRQVGYAGQFVGGIARSVEDAALSDAADLARTRGRRRPLLAALSARVASGPAI